MKGEINRDFYCSAELYNIELDNLNKLCNGSGSCLKNLEGERCVCCRRKWPTPEQYKEEYGEEYLNGSAVYWFNLAMLQWTADSFLHAKVIRDSPARCNEIFIICACTPWGKPPDNWRPEYEKGV
jgi:hypothetical protein